MELLRLNINLYRGKNAAARHELLQSLIVQLPSNHYSIVPILSTSFHQISSPSDLSKTSSFFAKPSTLISIATNDQERSLLLSVASKLYVAGITLRALRDLLSLCRPPQSKSLRMSTLRTLHQILNKNNETTPHASYFGFQGKDNGLTVHVSQNSASKWPLPKEWSFWTSFRANNFDSIPSLPIPTKIRSNSSSSSNSSDRSNNIGKNESIHAAFQHLLLLTTEDGEYVDIGFQGNHIEIRSLNSNGKTTQFVVHDIPLTEKVWYNLGIVCAKPSYFRSTEVKIYINGTMITTSNSKFVFPKATKATKLKSFIFGSNFNGQMGATYLLGCTDQQYIATSSGNGTNHRYDGTIERLPHDIEKYVLYGFHPRCRQKKGIYLNTVNHQSSTSTSTSTVLSKDHTYASLNGYQWTSSSLRDVLISAGGTSVLLSLINEIDGYNYNTTIGLLIDILVRCMNNHSGNQISCLDSRTLSKLCALMIERFQSHRTNNNIDTIDTTNNTDTENQSKKKTSGSTSPPITIAMAVKNLLNMSLVPSIRDYMEHEILFEICINFRMWSKTSISIQLEVMEVLIEKVTSRPQHYRKTIGIQHFLDSVRNYYHGNQTDVANIRGRILNTIFIMVTQGNGTITKNEIQSILCFVLDCTCMDSCCDVLIGVYKLLIDAEPLNGLYEHIYSLTSSMAPKMKIKITGLMSSIFSSSLIFSFLLLNRFDELLTNAKRDYKKRMDSSSISSAAQDRVALSRMLGVTVQVIGIWCSRSQLYKNSNNNNNNNNNNSNSTGNGNGIDETIDKDVHRESMDHLFSYHGGYIILNRFIKDIFTFGQDTKSHKQFIQNTRNIEWEILYGCVMDMAMVSGEFVKRAFGSHRRQTPVHSFTAIRSLLPRCFINVTDGMDDDHSLCNAGAITVLVAFFPDMPLCIQGRMLNDLMLIYKNNADNRRLMICQQENYNGSHNGGERLDSVWYKCLVELMEKKEVDDQGAVSDSVINSYIDIVGWLLGEAMLSSSTQCCEMTGIVSLLLRVNKTDTLKQTTKTIAHLCDNVAQAMAPVVVKHVRKYREDWHKRNITDGNIFSKSSSLFKSRSVAYNILELCAFVESIVLQGRETFNGDVLSCYEDVKDSIQQEKERDRIELEKQLTTKDEEDDDWVIDEWVINQEEKEQEENNEKSKSKRVKKSKKKKKESRKGSITSRSSIHTATSSTNTTNTTSNTLNTNGTTSTTSSTTNTSSTRTTTASSTFATSNIRTGGKLNKEDTLHLLSSLFTVIHPILHDSSTALRNRTLWEFCSLNSLDTSQNNTADSNQELIGSTFVFSLLRMLMLWLELLPNYSDDVLICVRHLSVVVECLLLTNKEKGRGGRGRAATGTGTTRSPSNSLGDPLGRSPTSSFGRSPTTSIDQSSGGFSGGSGSMGGMSMSMAAAAAAASSAAGKKRTKKRSSLVMPGGGDDETNVNENGENETTIIQERIPPRRSFAIELIEEEQWAIVVIKSLHHILIGIRNSIFGKSENSEELNVMDETNNRITPSSPLRGKSKNIEALTFTMPGSRLLELKNNLTLMHMEVSIASSVAEGCLTILVDVFSKLEDVLRSSLIDDFFGAFQQLVEDINQNSLFNNAVESIENGKDEDEDEDEDEKDNSGNTGNTTNKEDLKVRIRSESEDARVDSVNRSVTRMLFWSYSPWLMLPDLRNMDESSITALSQRDSRLINASIHISLRLRGLERSSFTKDSSNLKIEKNSMIKRMEIVTNAAVVPTSRLRHVEINRRASLEVEAQDVVQSKEERWNQWKKQNVRTKTLIQNNSKNKSTKNENIGDQGDNNAIAWVLTNIEDGFRQRRVLYPNLGFVNDHSDAVYGQRLSPSKAEKEKKEETEESKLSVDMMQRITSTSKLLDHTADPTKISQTAPQERLSFTSNSIEDEEKKELEEETNKNKSSSSSSSSSIPRDCSEEDAFIDMENNRHSFVFNRYSGSTQEERSFSLQRGESVLFSSLSCRLVEPLHITTGRLDLSNLHVFFYPEEKEEEEEKEKNQANSNANGKSAKKKRCKNRRWSLLNIRSFHKRRHLLCNNALEFFFHSAVDDSSTAFIVLGDGNGGKQERDLVLKHLFKLPVLKKVKSKLLNDKRISKVTEQWCKREMSNFDYLMHLNTISGRSFSDLSQYPVFPWVLEDYTSETLHFHSAATTSTTEKDDDQDKDQNNKNSSTNSTSSTTSISSTSSNNNSGTNVFRDLSKPIGAINPERASQFVSRYNNFDEELAGVPKFHYGSHYSSAGVVLHYLLRMEPFTTWAIELQGGKFDTPDRLFFSMSEAWKSCTHSMSDVKELIPEFYYNHHFLSNSNHFNLGTRQPAVKGEIGQQVNHVELPPWAKNSPYEFVRIMRNALESDYVSNHIHLWIDLIFGYKQRGLEAEKATNLFFYLTYEGAVDFDALNHDPFRKAATEEQINHFGQTPSQLFIKAHPKRKTKKYEDTYVLCPAIDTKWNVVDVPLSTAVLVPESSFFHKSSNKMTILKLKMQHPGIKMEEIQKREEINVLSIVVEGGGVGGLGTAQKLIVIYSNGTVALHKWSPNTKSTVPGITASLSGTLHSTKPLTKSGQEMTGKSSKEITKEQLNTNTMNLNLKLKFTWSSPKEIPMHNISSIHWMDSEQKYSTDFNSTNTNTNVSNISEEVEWWMKPRQELFAYSSITKLLFFGGCWDNRLKYCSFANGGKNRILNGPFNVEPNSFRDVVTCLNFAEDGLTLGAGSVDCTCQIWRIDQSTDSHRGETNMNMLHVLTSHQGAVTDICLSIRMDIIVSASMDTTISIHTLTNGQLLRSIRHPTNNSWNKIWLMGISKGDVLGYSKNEGQDSGGGTSGGKNGLHLYSVHGDELMSCKTNDVKGAVVTNNGELLLTGGEKGWITMRSLENELKVVRKIKMETNSDVKCMNVSKHHVLVGFEDGSLGVVRER